MNLDVQDATISQFHQHPPWCRAIDELIIATGKVMIAALTIALYVRELATRAR